MDRDHPKSQVDIRRTDLQNEKEEQESRKHDVEERSQKEVKMVSVHADISYHSGSLLINETKENMQFAR